jgi:hypothetical protein
MDDIKDIQDEINHQKQIIKLLRKSKRVIELQLAQQGITNANLNLVNESTALNDKILSHEDELTRLTILAAEDQVSFSEAKYRVLLAELWDTVNGRPTVFGYARLELERLQLGLSPEKGQHLEQEVRLDLARETVAQIDIYYLPGISNTEYIISKDKDDPTKTALRLLGKAIRLNVSATIDLLISTFPGKSNIHINTLGKYLMVLNRVWIYEDDRILFEQFLQKLDNAVNNSPQ